eukprot:GHVT01032955.1.p1 GENE.GHVT01032955.1~~GHVT01032955.1.p1  ORF type:complete len:382 (+),score=18.05 GHVT01032955.1:418-1563(+)
MYLAGQQIVGPAKVVQISRTKLPPPLGQTAQPQTVTRCVSKQTGQQAYIFRSALSQKLDSYELHRSSLVSRGSLTDASLSCARRQRARSAGAVCRNQLILRPPPALTESHLQKQERSNSYDEISAPRHHHSESSHATHGHGVSVATVSETNVTIPSTPVDAKRPDSKPSETRRADNAFGIGAQVDRGLTTWAMTAQAICHKPRTISTSGTRLVWSRRESSPVNIEAASQDSQLMKKQEIQFSNQFENRPHRIVRRKSPNNASASRTTTASSVDNDCPLSNYFSLSYSASPMKDAGQAMLPHSALPPGHGVPGTLNSRSKISQPRGGLVDKISLLGLDQRPEKKIFCKLPGAEVGYSKDNAAQEIDWRDNEWIGWTANSRNK